MAPWTARGTKIHKSFAAYVGENNVLQEKVEALVAREQQLRTHLEYWKGRYNTLKGLHAETCLLRYTETIRANNAELQYQQLKRRVHAFVYSNEGPQKETT